MHTSNAMRHERITQRNNRRELSGRCTYCMGCDKGHRYGHNGRKSKLTK